MENTQRYLSVREVSERLSLAQFTLRKWIRDGRIQSVNLGGDAIRIAESEIARLITAGARK